MAGNYERIIWLLNHHRPELAMQEIQQQIAQSPQDARLFMFQSLGYEQLKQKNAALASAKYAVQLAPDWCHGYYILANALYELNCFPEAEQVIVRAIALDPEDADYYGRHAKILVDWGRHHQALAAANSGLQLDAQHLGCGNLRCLALMRLGRWSEAAIAVEQLLTQAPESAFPLAAWGWVLLYQDAPAQAASAFRDALRLNPGFEWSQQGLNLALQSKFWLYRWLANYSATVFRNSTQPRNSTSITLRRWIGLGILGLSLIVSLATGLSGAGIQSALLVGILTLVFAGLGWAITSTGARLLQDLIGAVHLAWLKRLR